MQVSSLLKAKNYSLDNKYQANPSEKKIATNAHFHFNNTQVVDRFSHKQQALKMQASQPSLAKYFLFLNINKNS